MILGLLNGWVIEHQVQVLEAVSRHLYLVHAASYATIYELLALEQVKECIIQTTEHLLVARWKLPALVALTPMGLGSKALKRQAPGQAVQDGTPLIPTTQLTTYSTPPCLPMCSQLSSPLHRNQSCNGVSLMIFGEGRWYWIHDYVATFGVNDRLIYMTLCS